MHRRLALLASTCLAVTAFCAIAPNHPLAEELARGNRDLAEFVAECNRMGTSEAVLETAVPAKDIPTNWTVYPGHGASAGVGVVDVQRQYITDFRAAIQAQLGLSELTPDSTKRIVEDVRARHPSWPLEMLIPINAGAMEKELSEAGAQ